MRLPRVRALGVGARLGERPDRQGEAPATGTASPDAGSGVAIGAPGRRRPRQRQHGARGAGRPAGRGWRGRMGERRARGSARTTPELQHRWWSDEATRWGARRGAPWLGRRTRGCAGAVARHGAARGGECGSGEVRRAGDARAQQRAPTASAAGAVRRGAQGAEAARAASVRVRTRRRIRQGREGKRRGLT